MSLTPGGTGGPSTRVEYVDSIDPGTGDNSSNINTAFALADKPASGTPAFSGLSRLSSFPNEYGMDDWLELERLHFAAGDGDLNAVRAFVNEGRDINAQDSDLGLTPLHYAAAGEHVDVVRFLLSAGADVNAIDEATAGDTPLGHVAQECTPEMATILLDAGANPLIPGMMQLTPLHRAERRKRPEGRKVYDLLLAVAKSKFHY